MKVEQIATIMNTVFPNVTAGTTTAEDGTIIPVVVTLKEDCSNIADFGEKIDSQFALGDNFNVYFKKFADCIGKTIIAADEYDKEDECNIRKTSTEYGSIIRMLLFKDGDFKDNTSWNEIENSTQTAPPTFDEMFGLHQADADAIYWNRKLTLESEVYTVSYLQWKSATTSASQLVEFADMIAERWLNKMKQLKVKLRKMLVCSWIVKKYRAAGNGVFNVLAEYKKKFPSATTTAATAPTDGDFLRYLKSFIEITREDMRERTCLFNTDGYVKPTPRSRQKCFIYSAFAEYISNYLYSGTFHDDYVKLGGYETISSWESNGTASDDETKMKVHLQIGEVETTINGVVGTIFDDRAIFTVDEFPRTVAQDNNFAEWTNYKNKFDISLYCTTALNGAIFIISDYDFAADLYGLSSAPANWAAIITAGIYTQGADGTFTAVTSGTAYDDETMYFKKI